MSRGICPYGKNLLSSEQIIPKGISKKEVECFHGNVKIIGGVNHFDDALNIKLNIVTSYKVPALQFPIYERCACVCVCGGGGVLRHGHELITVNTLFQKKYSRTRSEDKVYHGS